MVKEHIYGNGTMSAWIVFPAFSEQWLTSTSVCPFSALWRDEVTQRTSIESGVAQNAHTLMQVACLRATNWHYQHVETRGDCVDAANAQSVQRYKLILAGKGAIG